MTAGLNYKEREDRIMQVIRSGRRPAPDVAVEYIEAKLALDQAVLIESAGGLFGPDALGQRTADAGDRYENALAALERDLGLTDAVTP